MSSLFPRRKGALQALDMGNRGSRILQIPAPPSPQGSGHLAGLHPFQGPGVSRGPASQMEEFHPKERRLPIPSLPLPVYLVLRTQAPLERLALGANLGSGRLCADGGPGLRAGWSLPWCCSSDVASLGLLPRTPGGGVITGKA